MHSLRTNKQSIEHMLNWSCCNQQEPIMILVLDHLTQNSIVAMKTEAYLLSFVTKDSIVDLTTEAYRFVTKTFHNILKTHDNIRTIFKETNQTFLFSYFKATSKRVTPYSIYALFTQALVYRFVT